MDVPDPDLFGTQDDPVVIDAQPDACLQHGADMKEHPNGLPGLEAAIDERLRGAEVCAKVNGISFSPWSSWYELLGFEQDLMSRVTICAMHDPLEWTAQIEGFRP